MNKDQYKLMGTTGGIYRPRIIHHRRIQFRWWYWLVLIGAIVGVAAILMLPGVW